MQTNLKQLQDKIKDLECKLSKANDDSSILIDPKHVSSSKNLSKGILKKSKEENKYPLWS